MSHSSEENLRTSQSLQKKALLFLRDVIIIIFIAILVSFLVKTFLIRSFYIPSGSMKNTLQIDDRILVNELVPTVFPLERGDVVVFKDPGGWLGPSLEKPESTTFSEISGAVLTFIGLGVSDSDDHLIKRVIGLPGDNVVCCNPFGQIQVNGNPIDEPYLDADQGDIAAGAVDFNVTVPADSLWVMGDNRWNSQDSSRNQNLPGKGFVPIDDVVGRAVLITWPFERWSVLDNYPSVFRGID